MLTGKFAIFDWRRLMDTSFAFWWFGIGFAATLLSFLCGTDRGKRLQNIKIFFTNPGDFETPLGYIGSRITQRWVLATPTPKVDISQILYLVLFFALYTSLGILSAVATFIGLSIRATCWARTV